MRKMKKIIASILSASFALSLCNFNKANAYYAGQMHTWRMAEKTSTVGLEWYSSTTTNNCSYTFGSSKPGNLIVNTSNFKSAYYTSLYAYTSSYYGSPKINGEGYLSESLWYTPTTTTSFRIDYEYETSNNATITPIYALVGDVNMDGYVNSNDVDYLLQYFAERHDGKRQLSEKQMLAADANNDGEVNVRDCVTINSFCKGDIKHF